ncbi:Hypothetical predicted protein [Marmota monax]|uniref:Small ribosomal subunit protein uS13 n=1 Tax=Marmota monax TaxID=9995 RepID=A0A5E4APL2_MARMO|nr:Hypothetical predicted protein [Marmota monax]
MSLVIPEKFQHILRVLNTNIDGRRKTAFAITAIKGVGRRYAHVVLRKADIDLTKRAGELTEDEVERVITIMQNPRQYKIPDWFLNRQKDVKDGKYSQVLANGLDNKLREDLERLKKIRAHRGLRHFWGLRVRGQHTKTTGRRGRTYLKPLFPNVSKTLGVWSCIINLEERRPAGWKKDGFPLASSIYRPHPWPCSSKPRLGNKPSLQSPQPPAATPEPSVNPQQPPRWRPFLQPFPHNGHTRQLPQRSRFFPPTDSYPARGSPFSHPNQLGTHPKASCRELTGGKGGGGGGSQRAQPGCCNGFRPVTILALGLSHCAKPNLPGTKMVGWHFDVKEPRRATSSGCAGEPERRQCHLGNRNFSLGPG